MSQKEAMRLLKSGEPLTKSQRFAISRIIFDLSVKLDVARRSMRGRNGK